MRVKILIPIVLVCATIASLVVIRQMKITGPGVNNRDTASRGSTMRWRKSVSTVWPTAPQAAASLIALGATPSAGVLQQQVVGMWADPPPAMVGLGGTIHATSPGIVDYYELE